MPLCIVPGAEPKGQVKERTAGVSVGIWSDLQWASPGNERRTLTELGRNRRRTWAFGEKTLWIKLDSIGLRRMGRFHRWVKSKLEDILEKEHSTVKDRKIERDCHVPGTVLSSLRACLIRDSWDLLLSSLYRWGIKIQRGQAVRARSQRLYISGGCWDLKGGLSEKSHAEKWWVRVWRHVQTSLSE